MIYQHVALGAKVIYYPGLSPESKTNKEKPIRRSTSASLLRCCRLVHNEYPATFYKIARLDITACIAAKEAVVNLPTGIKASMLHHIKVDQEVFSGAGAMSLLKSFCSLESLTYYSDIIEYDLEFHLDCGDDTNCECAGGGCKKCMLDSLWAEVNDNPMKLVGKCACQSRQACQCGCSECFGEDPIRKVIAVWEYLGQPFRLQAKVIIASAWTKGYRPLKVVSSLPYLLTIGRLAA